MKTRDELPPIWTIALTALIVFGAFIVWISRDDYVETLTQEYRVLESHARFGDARIAVALRSIDLMLQGTIADRMWSPQLSPQVIQQRQLNQLRQFPEIHFLITTDERGRVVTAESLDDPGSAVEVRKFDASRREYFTVHRDASAADQDRYVLSRPFKTITQRDTITVSRAIRDDTGRFLGVALVSMSPKYFEAVLQEVLPDGASSASTLLNRFGDVIYRLPGPEGYVGKNVAESAAFQAFLHSQERLTRYTGVAQLDGSERMFVYSKVGDALLGVAVSRELDQVLAGWRRNLLFRALGFALTALITMTLAWDMQRRLLERKRAQRSLQQSDERFRRAMEASNDGLWDWDIASDTAYFSPAYYRMLGYEPGGFPMRSDSWSDMIHPDDRQNALAVNWDCIENRRQSFEAEFRMKARDGSWKWILTRGQALARDEHGRATRMIGTHVDITERKRGEATQRDLESQLREAQKLEAIGTLAGGIAHDFNNMMAAILGNVAFAQQDIDVSHPAQAYLKQISKTGQRARSLVQQILAFSRKQPNELVSQSLRPVVDEAVTMLRSMMGASVQLRAVLPPNKLAVTADPTQLQQVLMNLGVNAWQALPAGVGHIEIGLEENLFADDDRPRPAGLEPGSYAHLWVRDDGCGMDAETRQRIFDPFFTTKPVGRGTGLGLAVAHGIVESHGGAITVTTAPGQGSTFDLYLPLIEYESGPAPLDAIGTPLRGSGQHVLYVDDDEVMGLMVHDLLQRLGYRATCLLDAHEAIALVARDPAAVDLVVTDFNMPNVSGLDVARALAGIRADLPVAISSGYVSDELLASASQLGVHAVMQKERTLEELGAMVHAALSASRWDVRA